MDKYASVCWRNTPDEINDALDAYRSRVLALESRTKELKAQVLAVVNTDTRCYEENARLVAENISLLDVKRSNEECIQELTHQREACLKVVDAAREFTEAPLGMSCFLSKEDLLREMYRLLGNLAESLSELREHGEK